jgi:hypothetical protein
MKISKQDRNRGILIRLSVSETSQAAAKRVTGVEIKVQSACSLNVTERTARMAWQTLGIANMKHEVRKYRWLGGLN